MRILMPEVAEKRKKEILNMIIYHYLNKGNPVSSKIVQSLSKNGISSASIRKIMMELENEGYLAHPHASAGRLPTDKAYRWFVDSLMEMMTLAAAEKRRIANEYNEQIKEINDLFVKTSHLLSTVSHYAGFIITPKPMRSKVINIEFIKVTDTRMMALIITDSGAVKHFFVNFPEGVDETTLRYLSDILNRKFSGKTLSELSRGLPTIADEIELKRSALFEIAKEVSVRLESEEEEEEIFIEGAGNIVPAIEISGLSRIGSLLNFIEQKRSLTKALESDLEKLKGVQVTFGGERPITQLKEISLIRTTYRIGENSIGVLGIIGPKRMEYPKMVSLVNYIGGVVNKTLEKIYK